MNKQDVIVRFCGIAGDGIVTLGRLLAGACARLGLELMVNDNFSAEIRGLGKSTTDIRFSPRQVVSMGDGIDVLVAMADTDSVIELQDLKAGACVIYDDKGPTECDIHHALAPHIPKDVASYPVPFKRLANEATGSHIGRNMVALGAFCYLFDLSTEMFLELIKDKLKKKGERVVEMNHQAFASGVAFCQEHYAPHTRLDIPKDLAPKQLITGNSAVAQGALDAGLSFFAGYPITPATTIMEIVARELPKLGGWMLQAEDEIAAIGAVLGASFAGKRAMTSTAGPGLSLMSEMINMAVMAEVPMVIVNVQRGGPSTGLPTKTEQGDLNIALYGGAGDSPRVVMAPATCTECYHGIQVAFDLAEKYQTPVIFLSDLFLGQRTVTTRIEAQVHRERCARVKPTGAELKDYRRFRITRSGVSPMLVPGEEGSFYTVTGLEHSELGNPNFESTVHRDMNDKRFRKFESMLADLPAPQVLGDMDAEIGLTGWGSPTRSIVEAMEIAREQGVKSKLIRSIMVYPQPEEAFRSFFASCRRIIIPEMNYQGQFAALMKSRYGIKPIEMHLPGIVPASPGQIAKKIIEVHHELAGEAACVGRT